MLSRRPVLKMLGGAACVAAAGPVLGRVGSGGSGLTFRWLNNAGFELILPSGAHLLIDPWLDHALYYPVSVASLERADYVLLSHTHGDHSDDVGAIQKRFPNVRLFVPQLSTEALVKLQNLDTSKIYKVSDGQEFRFGEVTIKAFAGRHTEGNHGNYLKWDDKGLLTSQSWGTLDLYQYLVTLPDGLKFMVWAGTPSIDNAYKLEGIAPDLAAVHISPKQDFTVLGEILRRMNPRIVMPHHYDIWPTILKTMPSEATQFPAAVQPVTPDTVIGKMMPYVEKSLRAGGMAARYIVPEHHRWYRYDRATAAVTPVA